MSRRKKPILEQVAIEDYAAEGRSLARVNGKVVFVEGLVPGDIADLRVTRSKKDWAEAVVLKMLKPSEERVEPFCIHFGVCGGCQWQMLPYEKQLVYKNKQVLETLKRIGRHPLPVQEPIAGAAETRFYRNKLEFTFSNKRFLLPSELGDEQISPFQDVAGYHARGLFDKVVEIRECWLQAEPTNALRNEIADYARKKGYSFYDIREHRGLLRTMQVRVCTTGEVMVNLVFGEDDKKKRDDLLQFIENSFPEITTLYYTINTKKNDSLFDLEPVVVKGPGYIIEKLEEFSFRIGPKSFFQTNTKQAEELYRITREFASLKGGETVYDLYCGTGSIGIFLSKKAGKIIGVEAVDAAVEDARLNAGVNGLSNAFFFSGDVSTVCTDDFFLEHGRPDVIITDPPRAGMHETLVRQILNMKAPLVVYVSCNPATQARDLQLLGELYEIKRMKAVDMFPHTHHVENVVQLQLK